MEKQGSELSITETDILDELVFTNSYVDLLSKFDEIKLNEALLRLLEFKLIIILDCSLEEEIVFEIEKFSKNFKDYYYLASKLGLKKLFN